MTIFYTIDKPEALIATSIDEAVDLYVAGLYDTTVPSSLVVEGYSPVRLTKHNPAFSYALDNLMESLDEEFDPEGARANANSEDILSAWSEFTDKVVSSYGVWSCEQVSSTKVSLSYVNGRLVVSYDTGAVEEGQ